LKWGKGLQRVLSWTYDHWNFSFQWATKDKGSLGQADHMP
jgi:hypothetical protein